MVALSDLKSFIRVETDRTIESDQFSHQEDAYYSGVESSIDAVDEFFEISGLRERVLEDVITTLRNSTTHDGCIGCAGGVEFSIMKVTQMINEGRTT